MFYFIIISALLLGGCHFGPVKMPTMTKFNLQKTPKNFPRYTKSQNVIIVAKPVINELYDNKQLWYTQVPYKLKSYAKNKWLVRPNNMIWSGLMDTFSNSGYFKQVVKQNVEAVQANYLLSTIINEMKQTFINYNKQSYVNLIMTVQVINYKTQQIISSKRFIKKRKTRYKTPYSAVKAYNDVLAILLKEIVVYVHHAIDKADDEHFNSLKMEEPF